MWDKTKLRYLTELYIDKLQQAAEETEDSVVRTIETAEDLGEQVYSVAESESKRAGDEVRELAIEILNEAKRNLPEIRKDLEKMEQRMREQIERLESILKELT